MSYNPWLYVSGNPLRYVDPSGLIAVDEADRANRLRDFLAATYGVVILQDWGALPIHGRPTYSQAGNLTAKSR